MIILTLRTDKPESEIGLFDNEKQLDYISWEAHRQLAETIHLKIKELLDNQKLDLDDIGAIVVYEGPGSFTGLRIGISVANALSYSLNVPIVGGRDEDWLTQGLKLIASSDNKTPIIPFYGSDAHITTPKK